MPHILVEQEEKIPFGLKDTHEMLLKNEWKMRFNVDGFMVYSKDSDIFDEFRIKLDKQNIQVSVPLPNSEFLYKCRFNNYFEACEFIEQHLKNYEESKKTQTLYDEVKNNKIKKIKLESQIN